MPSSVITLATLLGKPEFHPTKRMEFKAEDAVLSHIRSRRSTDLFPVTTDDLTTLLERHVEELDIYADLSPYGSGVEGLTIFLPSRRPIVKVACALSESRNENRLRSTLAHEYGHVVLHDPLFQRKAQDSLFDARSEFLQVSYRDGYSAPSGGDLFEYQAWFMCGALLMPLTELELRVQQLAERESSYSAIWQHSELGQAAIAHVADAFSVSEILARIRLIKAGLITEEEPSPSLF